MNYYGGIVLRCPRTAHMIQFIHISHCKVYYYMEPGVEGTDDPVVSSRPSINYSLFFPPLSSLCPAVLLLLFLAVAFPSAVYARRALEKGFSLLKARRHEL